METENKKFAGIASFTLRGAVLEDKIIRLLKEDYRFIQYEDGLKAWCALCFDVSEVIIFIGAAGIAVRTIAPLLKGKTEDPAVVVIDEAGQYVISLLSGHIGGANEFAAELAEKLGATPVITTASDVNGLVAVDVFAKKNHLIIDSMIDAKKIAAATLEGKRVAFYCDGKIEGECPPQWTLIPSENLSENQNSFDLENISEKDCSSLEKFDCMIWVSPYLPQKEITQRYLNSEEGIVLHLIPKVVWLGIGCRKGKELEAIGEGVEHVIWETQITKKAIAGMASIDLKKEEEGILFYSLLNNIPFQTYTSEELLAVPGEFHSSEFVKKTTGVDNVCERSALNAAGNGGRLIHGKYAENGVTAALALQEWRIHFEE